MGQGLYCLIGFGVLDPPRPKLGPDNPYWDGWCVLLGDRLGSQLQESREANPDYLVVPLAVTDDCLAREWQLQRLNRRAAALADVAGLIPARALAKAKRTWTQVQAAAAKHGVDLPDGQLILVSDWD